MSYDFKDIIARYLQDMGGGGMGQSGASGQYGNSAYIDPQTGLTVSPNGNGYTFSGPDHMNWGMDQAGHVGQGYQHTPGGLGSQVMDFAKEGGIPLALSALGANYLGPMANEWGGIGGTAGGSTLGTMGTGADMADLAMGGGGGALGSGTAGTAGTLAGNLGGISAVPATAADMAAGTLTPQSLGLSTIPATGAGLGSTGSFTDWFTNPGNLLKTVATVGALVEGNKSGDFTQSTKRDLDPHIAALLYGADGKGGALGDLQNWYQANKSGTNPAMQAGLAGLSNLATDPAVMRAIYGQGGLGAELMSRGVAKNPWGG